MKIEHAEAVWLDERGAVTLIELAECSGLTAEEVRTLVDYGALVPTDPAAGVLTFAPAWIAAARMACRLRDDFEVDARGLALALALLERIEDLESEVRGLRARLPGAPRPR